MALLAASPPRVVPAVDRAARVLAMLESESRPLGISDVARRLNASKGAVRDLLETLRQHGLLERDDESKQYRLGARLVRLGRAAAQRIDLPSLARPMLADLANASGETALLLVRQAERALILEKAEAQESSVMRVSAPVGRRIPLMAGATGKVFLAFAPAEERACWLAGLPRFTSASVVDPAQYEASLEAVRRQGYALDDQEYLDGVRAVAAPVLDVSGNVAAVLLSVGVAGSLTLDRLPLVAAATARAAETLSAALGAPLPT